HVSRHGHEDTDLNPAGYEKYTLVKSPEHANITSELYALRSHGARAQKASSPRCSPMRGSIGGLRFVDRATDGPHPPSVRSAGRRSCSEPISSTQLETARAG